MPSLAAELQDSTARATVPPTGGSVTLPGLATVTFPAGGFPTQRPVTVTATSNPETRRRFALTAPLYSSGTPLSFEIRIRTGQVAPAAETQVAIVVSQDYLNSIPAAQVPWLFAQIPEGSRLEHPAA